MFLKIFKNLPYNSRDQLLNVTKIEWYNNLDNAQPIQPTQPTPSCMFISEYDFIDLVLRS